MSDTSTVRMNLIADGVKYGVMLAENVMDESGRKASRAQKICAR